jgi:WD40 repeat protein
LPGITRDASFSADSLTFATQNGDGSISLWDSATLQEIRRCTDLGTNNIGVVYSPNGRWLAIGSGSKAIRLVDLKETEESKTLSGQDTVPTLPVGFSHDGQYLLTCELGPRAMHRAITPIKRCKLWAVDSGREVASWSVPPETYTVALAPDATSAVTGDGQGTVRFWDVFKATCEESPVAHNDWVGGVTFSPDGKLLATVSSYGDAKLWDITSHSLLTTLRGHLMGIHSVVFSPDGRRLVTASGSGDALKLWDVRTWQEIATLEGHGTIFQRVQFSPDGNALLAISLEGMLHLWRAPSFAEIETAEKSATSNKLPSSTKLP